MRGAICHSIPPRFWAHHLSEKRQNDAMILLHCRMFLFLATGKQGVLFCSFVTALLFDAVIVCQLIPAARPEVAAGIKPSAVIMVAGLPSSANRDATSFA